MDPVGPFPSQMLGMLGRQHLMGTLGDHPGNVDGQCLAVRRCTRSLSLSLNSPLASEPSGGPLGRRPGAPGEDDGRAAPAAARARSPARRAAGPGRSRRAPRSAPPLPPPPAGARSARHTPPEVFQPRAGGPDPLPDVHALVEPGEAERGTPGWGPEPNFDSVAPPGHSLSAAAAVPRAHRGDKRSQPPGHVLLKAYFQVRERGRGGSN